jgi:hypothetical protein
MAHLDLGKQVKKRFDRAFTIRQNFTWHWQEIANLVLPSRQFTVERAPGEKTNLRIFNSVAPRAARSLASALHGLSASPATRYYGLIPQDFDLSVSEVVRKFYYDASTRGLAYLASPVSGFQVAIDEMNLDLVTFGTGIMQVGISKRGLLRYNARQLANFYMCENPDGEVDETFRRFELTAVEAMELFRKPGDVLPDEIKDALEQGKSPDKKWSFVQMVARRLDRIVGRRDGPNKPWASVTILEKTGFLIRNGGFDRNPFITPRWSKSPEEAFGRSPASQALPDIKMINKMAQTTIMAAQQVTLPPMLIPANGLRGSIRLAPGSLNYTRTGTSQRPEPLITGADPRVGKEAQEVVALEIEKAFFLDALSLPELDRMTAEEVITRRQQGLIKASPAISRYQAEFLSPVVLELFAWQLRTRRLGEVPDGALRVGMKIDFTSPMAQSQKASEAGAVLDAVQTLSPFVAVNPGILQIIDDDKVGRFLWNAANADPTLLRTEEQVAAIRQREAQQQQMEQQVALAGGAAAAAKDAAAAGVDVQSGR